jgi:predicted transcriptional regulator
MPNIWLVSVTLFNELTMFDITKKAYAMQSSHMEILKKQDKSSDPLQKLFSAIERDKESSIIGLTSN